MKLNERLTDTVFSFRASRTIFRPYQFRPVIRLLNSGSLRLLIADEVGLGKTIEAGLVWTELDARGQANRVLVVCPSMLIDKWRAEMEERFGYDLVTLDSERLDDLLDRVETDRLPSRYHALCSLERLRMWPGLDRLAELSPSFDLVIVDEAHAFRNGGTKSNALGALLSDWADALVFLSATPLNLGNDDLYNLLELLAPGEFDDRLVLEERLRPNAVLNSISASFFDRATSNLLRLRQLDVIRTMTFGVALAQRPEFGELEMMLAGPDLGPSEISHAKRLIAQLHALSAVVSRTRKVEVQEHKAVREAIPIEVMWTEAERELYTAVDRWQRARARRMRYPVGFVTQMPLRLASSCLQAAKEQVLSRRAIDLDDDMDGGSDLDLLMSVSTNADLPPDDVLAAALRLGDVDTKFDAFLGALLPIVAEGRQVLVFTFSRKVLAHLARRLSAHVRIGELHGGIAKRDRPGIMKSFRSGEFDVMLASRVASEGLDFEFCSAVVNYDLPWNPMEVEQRIGRIDRFGQQEEKVLILNFHTPGTIETDIIERVHARIGVFTDSIGELEPILQSRLSDLRQATLDFELTPEQRERRLEEILTAIEEQRRTREEVETATSYLSSTDKAEIDGLEHDLVSHGRYVGQEELVLLIEDWIATAPGARCSRSRAQPVLTVRGTGVLEGNLRGVQAAGDRSLAEIDQLARALRDERDIHVSLEQEHARTTGLALLAANHPLVRAALRVPGFTQARFAQLALDGTGLEPGDYFVLVALARWTGVRPATEFWTAASRLGDEPGGDAEDVGARLLAGLADGRLRNNDTPLKHALDVSLESAISDLRRRQRREEARRHAENRSLTETRLISLQETHSRKLDQIRRRIATLRSRGNENVIHLHESQLRNQERLHEQAVSRLRELSVGSFDVEYVAACVVNVGGDT